jgi:hypothetical protein
MLNHLMAQALCARASSPLQQHSSFSTASSDSATMQMRHTASSAAMSSAAAAAASTSSSPAAAVTLVASGSGTSRNTGMFSSAATLLEPFASLNRLTLVGTDCERHTCFSFSSSISSLVDRDDGALAIRKLKILEKDRDRAPRSPSAWL